MTAADGGLMTRERIPAWIGFALSFFIDSARPES